MATGPILQESLETAALLDKNGLSAEVYSFSCIKPLDVDTIYNCATSSKLVVSIEEHNCIAGFGGAIAERLASIAGPHAPLLRIGMDDTYCNIVGDQNFLREYYYLDAKHIMEQIQTFWDSLK